jgi:hypothetical protein
MIIYDWEDWPMNGADRISVEKTEMKSVIYISGHGSEIK